MVHGSLLSRDFPLTRTFPRKSKPWRLNTKFIITTTMTNFITLQSSPLTISSATAPGGGGGKKASSAPVMLQGPAVSPRPQQHQHQQQHQQQQSSDQRDVVCLSRLNLRDEDEQDDTTDSSMRRRLQWQEQQECCPEFAAQWLAPAQPPAFTDECSSLQEDPITNPPPHSDFVLRRSSFHYNLHSKLHGLFKDDKKIIVHTP
jgi:hypothetical protein